MQKIMFNDKYGLTKAVMDEIKTNTRRIIKQEVTELCGLGTIGDDKVCATFRDKNGDVVNVYSKYKLGEEVAIAQSYGHCGTWLFPTDEYCNTAGYTNKMFVEAELMPHRIMITNIKVERLQDISEEDCLEEGVRTDGYQQKYYTVSGFEKHYSTPKEAFAVLIDKVSGKGTWEKNPWVFVYDFVLI